MSSIDVGQLLVCVLGRGRDMNFACLAAAVVTVAAAKKNSYSETLCAVSFSTFYCNYDSVTFFFDCGSLIACSIG